MVPVLPWGHRRGSLRPGDRGGRACRWPGGADASVDIGVQGALQGVRLDLHLREIALWISYDDGSTWRSIPVRRTTKGWVAETINPDGLKARFASLRMTAEDTSGRTADQTIVHAYAIRH